MIEPQERLEGQKGVWPMEDTMGGVYWGSWAAIGYLGGCGADPHAGRLRWGGAERPRRSQRERLRRGPGRAARAAGRLGRVLPRAPPRWPPQPPPLRRKPPPSLGPRVRPEETAEAETTEGRTVPGGWAQLL